MIYIVVATIILLLLWVNEETDWLKLRKGGKKQCHVFIVIVKKIPI
jgi:hypothetical protein